MGKVIAIANHKGGVGKTTSVASVGTALASRGYRTLLIDMDAQANLTASLLPDEERERTIYEALKQRKGLPIVELRQNLSIVPSSLSLAGIELELSGAMSREYIVRRLLGEVEHLYDFILLDCPPSLGLIAVNAFVASDYILVPLTAETLPIRGLDMIEGVISMVRENLSEKASLSAVFFTRWQGVKLNQMAEMRLQELYGDRLLSTKIRTCIAVAEAPLAKRTIQDYSPRSNGAQDYEMLTDELLQKILI